MSPFSVFSRINAVLARRVGLNEKSLAKVFSGANLAIRQIDVTPAAFFVTSCPRWVSGLEISDDISYLKLLSTIKALGSINLQLHAIIRDLG